MDLTELKAIVKNCRKCPLYIHRRNVVPGEGAAGVRLMFVGEAPGVSEDEQGRPFVGAAGRLLTNTLAQFSISRADVYITNVVKCRPPGNRTPKREEIEACLPYLLKEIAIVKPSRIIALGLTSGKTLLKLIGKKVTRLEDIRGMCHSGTLLGNRVEICVTYHPAAVLRDPSLSEKFREDLSKFTSVIS
ncbi:MAG: uracil-DNA glycosylase [Pyrobaculum sp.]